MSEEISNETREDFMVFQTIGVRKERTVLFAEISSPPMNLLGFDRSLTGSASFRPLVMPWSRNGQCDRACDGRGLPSRFRSLC
jgi:hypothetical protein